MRSSASYRSCSIGREPEGAHRRAHQRELRHEIFRRLRPVRLVGGIKLAAERVLRLVEDDGDMRRRDPRRAVAQELQHLGRKQPHRADRQPVGAVVVFLILPDRLEIGAEDERRAVDEKDVIAGADGTMGLGHARLLARGAARGERAAVGRVVPDLRHQKTLTACHAPPLSKVSRHEITSRDRVEFSRLRAAQPAGREIFLPRLRQRQGSQGFAVFDERRRRRAAPTCVSARRQGRRRPRFSNRRSAPCPRRRTPFP